MKKTLFSLFFLLLFVTGFSSEWTGITSGVPSPATTRLVSSGSGNSVVSFTIPGFYLHEVATPAGNAFTVNLGEGTPVMLAGAPDLPKLATSLVIPDRGQMAVRVIASAYTDFPGLMIAPSRGNISRQDDPSAIPYSYDQGIYSTDGFYPGMETGLREPYIVRDLRGQTLLVYPFQYNPVTKLLRVYHSITVEVYQIPGTGLNELSRKGDAIAIHQDFLQVYTRQFLNFDQITYSPLGDYGNLLVICHGPFMSTMEPYVKWKNSIGYRTEMVNVSSIGNTSAQIKTYITDYYNTYGLTAVLLVGDAAQIPTNTGSGLGGPSDNAYGYIVGNDHYSDVFIGRFSAENTDHVQTQVSRTINYEKNPQLLTDDWYTTVLGIASDQGPGDDGEYDYQHVRNMQTDCLAYTYTWNPELFDGSQGGNDPPGNPTPQQVSTEVNSGTGLILYTGHGSTTSWGTSGFSNANVNQLTNMDKLPFIWSVACVNGNFTGTTCFAEAWLRASQGGQPTGALAFLGSTINQSWNPPMEGQDEMVDILTEHYPGNIKRTFAGLSINGCMKMIDTYGNDGRDMADTWTVFGDPMVMVRTATPQPLTVTHLPTVFVGSTSLEVGCNYDGARATVSIADTMLASGVVANGTVTLTFPVITTPGDTLHLVVTGWNKIPYLADLPIITPEGPYILYEGSLVNDATGNNNHSVDYGEEIYLSTTIQNIGVDSTVSLLVNVFTADAYIDDTDTAELYGIVAPNQFKTVTDGFYFQTMNNIPDGHEIHFEFLSTDGIQSWTDHFTLVAHAPVLAMTSCLVNDSTGNNNGKLDPGETVWLKITVGNSGSSEAFSVNGNLIAISPWVNVIESTKDFGDISPGASLMHTYKIMVDANAPEGQYAPFIFEISAERDQLVVSTFNLIVGNIPVLVVNLDGNNNSAPAMLQAIQDLGIPCENSTTIPQETDGYTAIFVSLGVYPDKHVLSGAEGHRLATYVNNGGRLYMEGGDTWYSDPQTAVHPKFNIMGYHDGQGDITVIQGQSGTFTNGMNFTYNGDNAFIDRITFNTTAFNIFKNQTPSYFNATAYDGGGYKTIGSSFEFGGLVDGTYPSQKEKLMQEYLNFFGIQPPALMAVFAGYPTNLKPGESVDFMDFSTGNVESWHWSFPGGIPGTSTEENPVVTYPQEGVYDVQLIVSNASGSDTLLREDYITVDFATGIPTPSGNLQCTVIPNPNDGRFVIALRNTVNRSMDLTLYDFTGKPVYRRHLVSVNETETVSIDLPGLPQGIYLIIVNDGNEQVVRRVVVSR